MTQYEKISSTRPSGRTAGITCSFARLVALLGEPTRIDSEDSDGKVTVEWGATSRYDGDTIHVWDYKIAAPAEQNTQWSVNASSPGAFDRFRLALEGVEVEELTRQVPSFFEIMTADWQEFSSSDVNAYQGVEGNSPRIAYLNGFVLVYDNSLPGTAPEIQMFDPDHNDGQPVRSFDICRHD